MLQDFNRIGWLSYWAIKGIDIDGVKYQINKFKLSGETLTMQVKDKMGNLSEITISSGAAPVVTSVNGKQVT